MLLLLAACSVEQNSDPASNAVDASMSGETARPPAQANADVSQPILEEPRSPGAARSVLARYFELIEAGRRDQAANLWWDSDRAADFAAELRRFGDLRPNIAAPQRPEGAAGSVYVSVSLQLLRDSPSGIENLRDGTAVLRRVNDVPGSTEEHRQWRIDRITLQPPPPPLPAS